MGAPVCPRPPIGLAGGPHDRLRRVRLRELRVHLCSAVRINLHEVIAIFREYFGSKFIEIIPALVLLDYNNSPERRVRLGGLGPRHRSWPALFFPRFALALLRRAGELEC